MVAMRRWSQSLLVARSRWWGGHAVASAATSTYLDSGGQLLVTGPMWEQLDVHAMPYPSAPGAYLTDIESNLSSAPRRELEYG
jgi:hypothetical protein